MTISVTRENASVLGSVPQPAVRVTNAKATVLGNVPNPGIRATAIRASALGKLPAPPSYFTRITASILATRTPLYRFTNVITEDVFPDDISYNSVGSTRFATDVIVVDSGDDQRTRRWSQPLMEYDVAYGVRTMEQLTDLIIFFRAMQGRLKAFNYRDQVDHTSSIATAYEARTAPPITALDQYLATGDGSTYVFQLQKTYTTKSQLSSQVRPITRPDGETVIVAVNGAEVENWTVDATTGLVTFSSPISVTIGHSVSHGTSTANVTTLTGQAADFNGFRAYNGQRLVMSGWPTASNNIPISLLGATIGEVSEDGSSIQLNMPNGYGGTAETTTSLSLSVHPAPVSGANITAGFEFFVPVRFDTDTLPVTLEDYGVGSSNQVKLIEVRPSAW